MNSFFCRSSAIFLKGFSSSIYKLLNQENIDSTKWKTNWDKLFGAETCWKNRTKSGLFSSVFPLALLALNIVGKEPEKLRNHQRSAIPEIFPLSRRIYCRGIWFCSETNSSIPFPNDAVINDPNAERFLSRYEKSTLALQSAAFFVAPSGGRIWTGKYDIYVWSTVWHADNLRVTPVLSNRMPENLAHAFLHLRTAHYEISTEPRWQSGAKSVFEGFTWFDVEPYKIAWVRPDLEKLWKLKNERWNWRADV